LAYLKEPIRISLVLIKVEENPFSKKTHLFFCFFKSKSRFLFFSKENRKIPISVVLFH